jgi:pyruvate/2-oxoglutarate dehydrogenase complex dihydrolipoamide acyltransferase (E2) component
MAVKLLLPQIGFSMSEGTLTEWLVRSGDSVRDGQPIYSVESDKSVNEVEAPATGVITIVAEPGKLYQVGDVLGEIDTDNAKL